MLNGKLAPVLLALPNVVENELVRWQAFLIFEAVDPKQWSQLVAFVVGEKPDVLIEELKDLKVGVVLFEVVEDPVELLAPLAQIAFQAFTALAAPERARRTLPAPERPRSRHRLRE